MDAPSVAEVARIIETLSGELDALERAGGGVPAIEKNVVRLRGTLRMLQIQFDDLAALTAGEA